MSFPYRGLTPLQRAGPITMEHNVWLYPVSPLMALSSMGIILITAVSYHNRDQDFGPVPHSIKLCPLVTGNQDLQHEKEADTRPLFPGQTSGAFAQSSSRSPIWASLITPSGYFTLLVHW